MVSRFGSLGYTIMGKTADLTVVQKTIIDTLHKEGKPQTFIAKDVGCSQSVTGRNTFLNDVFLVLFIYVHINFYSFYLFFQFSLTF